MIKNIYEAPCFIAPQFQPSINSKFWDLREIKRAVFYLYKQKKTVNDQRWIIFVNK